MTRPPRWPTTVTSWVEAQTLPTVIALAVLLGLGAFAADLATGSQVSLSIFYLIPISVVGWRAGRAAALISSLVAAAALYAAELIGDRVSSQPLIPVWNGLVWFGLFAIVTVLLVNLRDSIRNQAVDPRVDALTGVLNRRAFIERAELELARAARRGDPVTVAYFDIDHFERFNDSAGQRAGDDVLRRVGTTARDLLRRIDVVGRLGGDTFAVVLPGAATDKAPLIIERIHRSLAESTASAGVTYSFGVVCFDPPPREIDTALTRVEAVLSVVKAHGGDGVRYERTAAD